MDDGSGSGSDSGSGAGSGSTIPPNVMVGSIYDERNDVIDFGSGQPVHTHTGAQTDLSSGCPAVYKYAYLMDQHAPQFGHENVANPLAWKIRSDSVALDTTATAYRVRDANNAVLADWTSITADAQGVFHVSLFRDAIPKLGTTTGQVHVDVRFRNVGGSDMIDSACFDNHPLAAPLSIAPAKPGALFSYSFANHSKISQLLNFKGPSVYDLPITQYTAEPVALTVHVPAAMYTATRLTADTYVKTSDSTTPIVCPDYFHGACAQTAIPAPVYANVLSPNVATQTSQWVAIVTDDIANQPICEATTGGSDVIACMLPGRAANEVPHAYHVGIILLEAGELAPPFLGQISGYADYTAGAKYFTSVAPVANALVTCANVAQIGVYTDPNYHFECHDTASYEHVSALKEAKLDFPAYSFGVTTAPTATSTFVTPPNTPASYFQMGADSWDSGDDGL
ncbi:MAG: hypothetical protein ABJE66_27595 [Deltaproteobacteria bacterium]